MFVRRAVKQLIFVLVLLLFLQAALAKTDSLQLVYTHATDSNERLHAGVLLAQSLMPSHMDSAIVLLNEAAPLAQDAEGVRKADYYNMLGIYYWYKNQPEKAIALFRQTMEMQPTKALLPKKAQAANNIGTLFNRLGETDSTRKYLNIALEIDTDRGNQRGIAKTMYDLGMFYFQQDQHELALRYLLEAQKFQRSEQDTFRLIHTFTVIGNVYNHLDSAQKAVDQYRKCAELAYCNEKYFAGNSCLQ